MTTLPNAFHEFSRKHLSMQGYTGYSDEELTELKPGIRFAYIGCAKLVSSALFLQQPVFFLLAAAAGGLTLFLPYHPFDYIYNYGVRFFLRKPAVPPRPLASKLACFLVFVWLMGVYYLYTHGDQLLANLLATVLLVQAIIVGMMDVCMPSVLLHRLFKKNKTTPGCPGSGYEA